MSGRRQPALRADAVRPDERDVDVAVGEGLQRPGVDRRLRPAADPAADHQDGDVRPDRQRHRDRQRVRQDDELAVRRQGIGEPSGRRAGIEQDRPLVGQLGERQPGDPLLLGGEDAVARRQGRLEAQPLDRDGAAVDAAEERVPLEGRQVATDRLGRDAELLGERRDLDPAAGPRALDDPALALLGVHVG